MSVLKRICLVAPILVGGCVLLSGLGTLPSVSAQQSQHAKKQSGDRSLAFRQIELKDIHIKRFLAVQTALLDMAPKLEAAGDVIGDKLQKELDALAAAKGFMDFEDFEDVRSTIMLVLAGIDPDTGVYSDPIQLIEKDIEHIKTDKELPEEERAAQISEMEAALKQMQPLEHAENIDLVKRHAKAIDDALR